MIHPRRPQYLTIPQIHYRWVVVVTGFVIWTTVFGIQYSFGIFFNPLQETFGWSRATISWAMTIHVITFALSMVPAGWAIDRFNPRIVFSIAALLIGFSLVSCSRISEPWQLYLFYGLPLGIGVGVCGPAIMAIVTRWFVAKRGLALGITSSGIGFGTLAGAAVSSSLITSYGWRDSFAILGIAGSIILLVCAHFIKNPPQPADGQGGLATIKSGNNNNQALKQSFSAGMTLSQAVQTKEMLFIMLTQSAVFFTIRTVMVHIVPYAVDKGISPPVAALAVGLLGGSSLVGRLVMGFVQDKIGARHVMIICLTSQAVSMLALPFIRVDLVLFIYAMIFGFAYGGNMPQVPAITAQCFGLGSITMVFGLMSTVANLIGAFGPIMAGYTFDLTGSYIVVFLGAATALLVAILSISKLRLPAKGSGLRSPSATVAPASRLE